MNIDNIQISSYSNSLNIHETLKNYYFAMPGIEQSEKLKDLDALVNPLSAPLRKNVLLEDYYH